YEHEKHNSRGNKRLPVQSGSISHLKHDVCRKSPYSLENAVRYGRLVSGNHDNGHCLSDGASNSKYNAAHYSGFGRNHYRSENSSLLCRAKGEGALEVCLGHGSERRLRNAYDRGKYHYSKKQ